MIEYQLPQGYSARPATLEDAPEITRLINLDEIAVEGKAEMTESRARSFLTIPGMDLEQDSLVLLNAEGHIVGFCMLFQQLYIKFEPDMVVSPMYWERGLGDFLLAWSEERARKLMARSEPDLRATMAIGLNIKHQANIRLFERHGFQNIRHTWRMSIELKEEPPRAIWPEGVRLETFKPGMDRVVYDSEMEFFKDHWGFLPRDYEEWHHFNLEHEHFDPTLYFLPMAGNDVVAMALCRNETENEGWINTLGVRRDWRRHGLGLALLHHAFGEFYRRGIHQTDLYVDAQSLTGATKLYERAGMHVVQQATHYEKELRVGKELSTQSLTE